jgi:leucyl aminopeptidase (aminopeptidase T)
MAFELKKLLTDVFRTEAGEVVLVACDLPHDSIADTAQWRDRRAMAAEWREAFAELGRAGGFEVRPVLTFAATGANGADLPASGLLGWADVAMDEALLGCTLALFMTEFSATAALDGYCRRKEDFRAASMPGLERRMERSSLSADYAEVARRCAILNGILEGADRLEVRFSTGQSCSFDLRWRKAEVDDGCLPRGKPGDRIINLPSGETFIVPYEGERAGEESRTAGRLPVEVAGELVVLSVEANRIRQVEGSGPESGKLRGFFAADPARANIAEVAFGCNDWAVVTGNVLEDEKAGFHWAYGRSDHLGGTVGVKAFLDPRNVVHQDIVYAKGNPIQVAEAAVTGPAGRKPVIRDGSYVVF